MARPTPFSSRAWQFTRHHVSRFARQITGRCSVCGTPCAPAATHAAVHTQALPGFSVHESSRLCRTCAAALCPRKTGYCPGCGMIYAEESLPATRCSACLKTAPPWDTLTFVAAYTGLLRKSILRFKFHNALEIGPVLGSLLAMRLAEQVTPVLPDDTVIIPVPLHDSRLRERGFNQTLELSRSLSRALGLALQPHLLRRDKATLHQIGLSRSQRTSNLQQAFIVPVPQEIAGRTVLLVDDIMTTGATAAAAVRTLRTAGASAVHIAVVARTPDAAGK